MNDNKHVISKVIEGSLLDKKGVLPGDSLIRINGNIIEDVFDYRFMILENHLEFELSRNDEVYSVIIDKDDDEDPGIEFEQGLMDDYRSCKNKCIFCFIDQMPKGMRETLYFKDDDNRLSFLQGNYVTLTNLSDKDVERIIKYKMEPLNISFQTTNPELRCKMLHNRFAGDALKITDRLYEGGITMNGQIVLCKGVNDGDELRRTITDLMKYLPLLESVSVVPVGLSKYRDGLYPLEPFNKEDAREVISIIEGYQKECFEKYGLHFIHASDEWYILAGYEMPEEERYDGYLQLENGVGMIRLQCNEFNRAVKENKIGFFKKLFMKPYEATVVTGRLAYPYIKQYADIITTKYPKIKLDVVPIRNDFFGEMITVAGLLTGGDIVRQLKDKGYYKNVLLPQCLLKADEPIFLDDMKLSEFEDALQVKTKIVKSSGYELYRCLMGLDPMEKINE